jgi:hypothetical protein
MYCEGETTFVVHQRHVDKDGGRSIRVKILLCKAFKLILYTCKYATITYILNALENFVAPSVRYVITRITTKVQFNRQSVL